MGAFDSFVSSTTTVKNKFSVGAFMADFPVLLEGLSIFTGEHVLTDDLNSHAENHENDQHAQQLLDLIDAFRLIQHVLQPTHLQGQTLDLIISRLSETVVQEVSVEKTNDF